MGFVVDKMVLGEVFLQAFLCFHVSNVTLLLHAAVHLYATGMWKKRGRNLRNYEKIWSFLAGESGKDIALILRSLQGLGGCLLFISDVDISVLSGSSQLFNLQIISSSWASFLSSQYVQQEYRNGRIFYWESSKLDRETRIVLQKE